jgi:hypothetical protein
MADVIFERIAPIVTVHDLDAALARYRRLGFATELYAPAQYGFVERGGVQLHLVQDDPDDPGGTGGVVYVYVSDADALRAEWASTGVEGRFMGTHRTVFGSSSTPTPTASCIRSAHRCPRRYLPPPLTCARGWATPFASHGKVRVVISRNRLKRTKRTMLRLRHDVRLDRLNC